MGNVVRSMRSRFPMPTRKKNQKRRKVSCPRNEEFECTIIISEEVETETSSSQGTCVSASMKMKHRRVRSRGPVRTHSVDMTYDEYNTGGDAFWSKRKKPMKRTKSSPEMTTPSPKGCYPPRL